MWNKCQSSVALTKNCWKGISYPYLSRVRTISLREFYLSTYPPFAPAAVDGLVILVTRCRSAVQMFCEKVSCETNGRLSLSPSLSLHDKLSDSDCDSWTSSPREDIHFKEAHSLPKLDRCANKRYWLQPDCKHLFVYLKTDLHGCISKPLSQSSMSASIGGNVWRSTSHLSFSVLIMKKG